MFGENISDKERKNTSSNKNYWQPICFILETGLWHVITWNIRHDREKNQTSTELFFMWYQINALVNGPVVFFLRERHVVRLAEFQ